MASPLNRSNATTNRSAPAQRLYTPTTPRGQVPLPILPRLQIPQPPRVHTNNLPPMLSIGRGDQAARQQSREVHNQGLSIVTRGGGQLSSPPPPMLDIGAAEAAGAAMPQPQMSDIAGQLGQLSLGAAGRAAPAVAVAAAAATPSNSSSGASLARPSDDEEEYTLEDANIKVMRKLGEGSVGTVHKVEHLPTKKIMARKLMAVYPDETNHKQILRELRLLKQCQSPYIVKFYGAYHSSDDDGQSIAICMEYCEGGSLENVYKRAAQLRAQIGEKVLGKVAVAVLNGLVHLHSYRVIHRDVKPSNVLVTGRGEIKLCDFGVSGDLVDSIAQTFVGTSYYMAPERIQGDRYAVQSDVWSLGLTLIEVSQNQFPFPPPGHPQLSVIELLEYIIHMPVPEMDSKRFSPECCDFVKRCLIKEPSKRPTPSQLLDHPFIVKAAAKRLDLKSWIEKVWGVKK